MDSNFYVAATTGDYPKFLSLIDADSSILNQTTMQKNTILHVAAAFNRRDIAEETTMRCPSIVYATNTKDDTALHLAARLGSFEVAKHLIEQHHIDNDLELANDGNGLLTMVNFEGDTALHDAVRNGHGEIAKLLVTKCPRLGGYINLARDSALFLAAENDYLEIAKEILEACSNCSYSGRDGANVLHAIIIRTLKRYTKDLIETPARVYLSLPVFYVNSFLPRLMELPYWERKITNKLTHIQKDLIKEVFNKFPNILNEPDNHGWLPLHYAASLGSQELVELILNHKPSLAYTKDNNGASALHLASNEGCLAVVKTFAKLCPDSCELSDLRGRTALHYAVANRQVYTVRKMLELPSFRNLVNQPDMDGNTALHLAAITGDYIIVTMFVSDQRVDKKIVNRAGFTTNDIIRLSHNFNLFEKTFSVARLEFNGALQGIQQVLAKKPISNALHEEQQESPPNITQQQTSRDNIYKATTQPKKPETWNELFDANLVVATIIATVTFSATVQVPGAYGSNGIAILRNAKDFRLYLIFDALSFGFATASMFITLFTGLFGVTSKLNYWKKWMTFFTGLSVWFMVFAFMMGTSVGMDEHSKLGELARCLSSVAFISPVLFLGVLALNWFTY